MKLDDIRAAVEAKYKGLPIEQGSRKFELANPLRLPKEKRDALSQLQERMSAEGEDQAEVMREMIRLTATSDTGATAFIAALGDDLAMLAEVIEQYGKATKVGEASGSQE